MTKLSMTIDFTPNVILLGFLWVASPTAPPRFELRPVLEDLPIFGGLFLRWTRRRSGGGSGVHESRNAHQQQSGRQAKKAAEA